MKQNGANNELLNPSDIRKKIYKLKKPDYVVEEIKDD